MPQTYDTLQRGQDDEYTHLYWVEVEAVRAINTLGRFTPPRVQPSDVRIFFETSPDDAKRCWIVTIEHGNRFVVHVTLDMIANTLSSQVSSWETTPNGWYYVKSPVETLAPRAPKRINTIYAHQPLVVEKGKPIGYAVLVGHTNDAREQAVFWLYDDPNPEADENPSQAQRHNLRLRDDRLNKYEARDAPAAPKRRISGNYILQKRRFLPLPHDEITWDEGEGTLS